MEEHVATWLNFLVELEPVQLRPVFTVKVLTAWLVSVILLVLIRRGTARMELRPTSNWQVLWEWVVQTVRDFARNAIGPGGEKHTVFLGTLFIYIAALSLFGIIPGFISPTASLTMTGALALTTVAYVQICGFRAHGWRYLLHFVGHPVWLAPLNVVIHTIGELARVLSLAIRLFGNIFGEDTVIAQLLAMGALIYARTHVPVPLHFPMVVFHIFVSFVQALVFTMLAAAYIAGAEQHHDGGGGHEDASCTAAEVCAGH